MNFFLDILTTLKAEKGSAAVTTTIKKSGLDSRLMEFFPPINQQQTEENFAKTFKEKNLGEVVNFRKQYAADQNRNVVYKLIKEAIEDEKTPKEIIIEIRDINDKNNITEQDTLIMVCRNSLFLTFSWNCTNFTLPILKKDEFSYMRFSSMKNRSDDLKFIGNRWLHIYMYGI